MHLALLGDSIFDNVYYLKKDEKPVIEHVRHKLSTDSTAELLAVDGTVVSEMEEQLERLSGKETHIFLSCGGNDALGMRGMFSQKCENVHEAISKLERPLSIFRQRYGALMLRLASIGIPVTVCTVYDHVPGLSAEEKLLLSVFNDTIIRESGRHGFSLVDLRHICTEEDDYSTISPIEPSGKGGMKIAQKLMETVGTIK